MLQNTAYVSAGLNTAENAPVGQIVAVEKVFKTGSKGYYGNGKLFLNGKKYQVSVQLVEIGSKPE